MYCMCLVETEAQYTNKDFQKSLVGVIILCEEVEKGIALNTTALRCKYDVNSFGSFENNSTNHSGIYPMNPVAAPTEARTTVSICS